MQRLIESARKAAADNSRIHVQTVLAQIDAHTQNKSFYDRLRCPDPESVATIAHAFKPAFRAQTERALAICAIALKRYELRHGKLPASLEALVPEFLPSVPPDCMDGKPVKYRLGPTVVLCFTRSVKMGQTMGAMLRRCPAKKAHPDLGTGAILSGLRRPCLTKSGPTETKQ